ncbi:MAG: two-component system, OmpR family, phosphate regulon sensor histidine kinase PhoR [bacterium]|nr:two-component system, OmpR family, phosphate regulon sensor histidine kinase PhoR [bacterium]
MEDMERRLTELRQAYEELVRLYRLTEEVGLASSIENIKETLLRYVDRLAPSINEKYLILDKDVPSEISNKWQEWEKEGLIEWIKGRGKTTIIPEDDLTYVITPLTVQSKVIGMLVVSTSACLENFNQQVLNLLDTIAHQCAVGIENIRLHKEIEDMRNFLEDLFNQLPQGILVVEMNGKIKSINRKLLELLGTEEKSLSKYVGKRLREVFPDVFSLKLEEIITETLIKGNIEEEEFTYQKNEKEVPFSISATLFKQEQEQGIILIIRDISESKELEKLRRLDKLKSEFISSVSHELKTPLTAIKGFIELLLDDEEALPSENARIYLNFMNEEINNLTQLINELLDFSKLEANQFHIDMQQINIGELIEKAVSMFDKEAREKGITIHREVNGNIPPIKGDKGKLLHVLTNLIDNAIKYIGTGRNIWLRVDPDNGRGVTICVEDEGIGIPKESIPYIFDKFYRVESDYSHKVRGLGLGLSIAKQFVEAHRGKIWVESEPGKGSKFFIYLPTFTEGEESLNG